MPAEEKEKCRDTTEGVFRFVVLYLTRFKDSIRLREGSRLEVTFCGAFACCSLTAVGACRHVFLCLEETLLLFYYHPYQYVKDAVKKGDMATPVVSFDVI